MMFKPLQRFQVVSVNLYTIYNLHFFSLKTLAAD